MAKQRTTTYRLETARVRTAEMEGLFTRYYRNGKCVDPGAIIEQGHELACRQVRKSHYEVLNQGLVDKLTTTFKI